MTLLVAVGIILLVSSASPTYETAQFGLGRVVVPLLCLVVLGLGVLTALRVVAAWATAVGLIVVALAALSYAVSISPLMSSAQRSDSIVLSLPVVAVTVLGVGQRSLRACLALCGAGYVVAESAMVFGASRGGRAIVFDYTALASFAAISIMLIVLWKARAGVSQGASALHLAAREEAAVIEEARVIRYASSLLHDTVLSDLHALAMLEPGPISDDYLAVIRRDLAILENSDDVLLSARAVAIPGPIEATGAGALAQVLERLDARGLRVIVSGDPVQLTRLEPAVEEAMVSAIEQCLVNVAVHAGVLLAELAIVTCGREVTAMVTDSGVGFDQATIPVDRLGLRLSVQERLASHGGTVTIWSTPGAGTSILLVVPAVAQ